MKKSQRDEEKKFEDEIGSGKFANSSSKGNKETGKSEKKPAKK